MTLNALDGKYKHAITEHSSYINSDLSDKEIYKYGEMYRKADLVIAVRIPFSSLTKSSGPPHLDAITGRPEAIASMYDTPKSFAL